MRPAAAGAPATTAERYRAHVNVGLAQLASLTMPAVEATSDGCWVWDEHGERYLDVGGFGVFILGHRHPAVVRAVHEQLDRHPLGTRLLLTEALATAAEALAGFAPAGLEYVYLTTSGTEAVETALKLARLGGRRHIVATHGGYHGKTLGSLSAGGREVYRAPFAPLLPQVRHVPYGDAGALTATLAEVGEPACVLLEPIQGERGVILPPDGYLAAVRAACTAAGALLVVDEVLTGFGRTGHDWACAREDVTPDILVAGKGLGGGVMPVGAAIATPEAFAPLNRDPFLHSSTFGGSPLASAAVAATVGVMREERVAERAAQLGPRVQEVVERALDETCPHLVREVRGAGLLVGVEMVDAGAAGELIVELMRRRVIVSPSLNGGEVVRLTPPVTLGEPELDLLAGAFAAAGAVVAQRHSTSRRTA